MVSLSDGSFFNWNGKARAAALIGYAALLILPFIGSATIGKEYENAMEEGHQLPVLIVQPNIDPYNKFQAMTQDEQNALLELQAEKQRLMAEREMTQMAEEKLEDLRCIRHDLKIDFLFQVIQAVLCVK